MEPKNKVSESMTSLFGKLEQKRDQSSVPWESFLNSVSVDPRKTLRNIFQLMYDMIHYYIPAGTDEYPNDPHSINYIHYDTSDLFIKNTEVPFFADRLLANRLINVVDSLKRGVLKNKMLVFIGPPGSGKSTFLNIFLEKLEDYCGLDTGEMYETVWHLDTLKIGVPPVGNATPTPEMVDTLTKLAQWNRHAEVHHRPMDNELMIPCPSHDHPIVQIPVEYRRELLEQIIDDEKFKYELFSHKEYEWVLTKTPCPICSSIYKALSERVAPETIFNMLYVRRYEFSRQLGEGISVYNPGDQVEKRPLENPELQRWLDSIFKSSNAVSYTYSRLAKTNNGIFAIMDVKSNNVDRVKNIHGIISDGIHKVGTAEETINSLFMALVNPEDFDVIEQEKSFRDRVINIPVPYIRDYTTEVEIYRNSYRKSVFNNFMPRILTVFAQIIVSSRLEQKSEAIQAWIKKPEIYEKMCDKDLLILLMEMYSGSLPPWLSEEDVQGLSRTIRRQLVQEGEKHGRKGFSGRESIEMFNSFVLNHSKTNNLVTIDDVIDFFRTEKYLEKLPTDFLSDIRKHYDYTTLQEVKESMFFYNQQQIANEIKNYLFAITVEEEAEMESPYTNDVVKASEEYLHKMEVVLLGGDAGAVDPKQFRNDQLCQFVSSTLHQIKAGVPIDKTAQYRTLSSRFNRNLKENVMAPFLKNENFRRAIKDFDTPTFETYDKRIRAEVSLLFKTLETKFSYSRQGARQICIYTIDNELANRY